MVQVCRGRVLCKESIREHQASLITPPTAGSEEKGARSGRHRWPCVYPRVSRHSLRCGSSVSGRGARSKACPVKRSVHCQVLSVHMQVVYLWRYNRSATLETPAWTAGLKVILWMTEKFCSVFQILFLFFHDESLKYMVQGALPLSNSRSRWVFFVGSFFFFYWQIPIHWALWFFAPKSNDEFRLNSVNTFE